MTPSFFRNKRSRLIVSVLGHPGFSDTMPGFSLRWYIVHPSGNVPRFFPVAVFLVGFKGNHWGKVSCKTDCFLECSFLVWHMQPAPNWNRKRSRPYSEILFGPQVDWAALKNTGILQLTVPHWHLAGMILAAPLHTMCRKGIQKQELAKPLPWHKNPSAVHCRKKESIILCE